MYHPEHNIIILQWKNVAGFKLYMLSETEAYNFIVNP